jgi:hypothetical protein
VIILEFLSAEHLGFRGFESIVSVIFFKDIWRTKLLNVKAVCNYCRTLSPGEVCYELDKSYLHKILIYGLKKELNQGKTFNITG